jgi:mannose-1-phosphate guanylyltransferase
MTRAKQSASSKARGVASRGGDAPAKGMEHAWAVILAGGSGTRFWPASRRRKPKQFLAVGSDPRSLLRQAWERLDGLVPAQRRMVVCAKAHSRLVSAELPELEPANILREPSARNTLPAVAWAMRAIAARDPGAVACVLPSDHAIGPEEAFRASLHAALRHARGDDALVVFGIPPDHPATGYGWIELGAPTAKLEGARFHKVARFVEKPPLARARRFLAGGRHAWNSGMFAFGVEAFLSAVARHAPEVADGLRTPRVSAKAWQALPSVSIDHGVMEHHDDVVVLPVSWSWNDVGAWPALAALVEADAADNRASGRARLVAEDAHGNLVHADDDALVALVGVEDLVVVRSGKCLLVCRKDRAQDVRRVVERLASEAPEEA